VSSLQRVRARVLALDADTATKALWLLALASDQGISLRVTSTTRSFATQTALYAQGRKSLEDVNLLRVSAGLDPIVKMGAGAVVTWAKAGESWHNYGRAFDVVPILNKKPDWLSPAWDIIGEMGEECGLEWGGRWSAGKKDVPHFQNPQGKTLAQAALALPGGMPGTFV